MTAGSGYKNDGYDGDMPVKPKKSLAETASLREKVLLSPKEKWRILKNISIISFAFMVQFTAFQGIANLQSSINATDGLGTVSLSAVYAALVVSCIFLPTLIIRRLTVKWTLVCSMLCYLPYIGLQLFPKFYTLVPAGILVGLGAAPMWASKATYLTQVGQVYAKITDQPIDAIIVRFFGFFFLAWQTAELWGNLISSLVLSTGAHGGSSGNDSQSDEDLESCGANFCAVQSHGNIERPPEDEIFEITIIYLACIVAAVATIAFLLDPLSRYGEKRKGSQSAQELSGIELLSATFHQMKKANQQLLIPITVFIGMEQAFIGADFTQAFVSCALGVHQIGYVMICFGVVNAICSILFGSIMKYIGRIPIITLGAIVHFTIITVMLFWRPHPSQPLIFFAMSGLWGVGDAVWQTQINGLYGLLFRRNKEAAFSNYRLWESIGFVVAYAYATTLCANMKLYILLAVITLGVLGYVIVEIRYRRKQKRIKKQEEEAAKKPIDDIDPKTTIPAPLPIDAVEETDDEMDDLEEDIVVTHF
ncbi:UNC93-like protein [Condylostylus longicornis]|uniref:UNC93-like protein n=1 Tax=Condylostylus longicornis TaxID=2530218 RepID=UPI00244DAD2F|nr:UNC93-like protein [Condylostylus longicornis]XP_055389961.1 UNC93-like protein [Condylostylus longicornis]XP_055389962.1 UNC93-like protein [Condylostylus longicornis]XP_055389963.1 UNC93-like protein [Condylostylus longicornis]